MSCCWLPLRKPAPRTAPSGSNSGPSCSSATASTRPPASPCNRDCERPRRPPGFYRAEEILSADHRFASWISAGIAYEHRNSTNSTPFDEERIASNQTLYVVLPNRFGVDFRTEENFRWLLSGFSVRLRERARVHRSTEIQNYTFTPMAWTEVFWDSRFDSFSRYRLGLGANFPVYKALSLQPYFMREVNYEAGINTINDIFGMAVISSF